MKNKHSKEKFLEELFGEMYRDLKLFLYHYSFDKELVEDILHETYFEAYVHAEELMGNENYRGWMYSTAINKAKKMNKVNQRYNEWLSLDDQTDAWVTHEEREYEIFSEIRENVALDEFELVMMHYRDNYTYEEMAKMQNKSMGYMKMKINRIIKNLRKKIDRD